METLNKALFPSTTAKVLVVEDDPSYRSLLCQFLRRDGLELLEASSGDEALDWAIDEPIDLMLVDYDIPQIDGLQLCRTLRVRHRSADLPMLMVTGSEDPELPAKGFAAGCNEFIRKPVKAEVIRERVDAWLQWKAEQRQSAFTTPT